VTARERLYLTSDRRRVVEHGNRDAAFLLVAPGAEIMTNYVPLVEAFYAAQAAKKQGKPEPLPDNTHAEVSTPPPPLSADETEGYEKRIPTIIRRRGRPPKASKFAGDPGD
jgi:hypothetical protein